LGVVLDDAVVDKRKSVSRDVRMRIALTRHPVGGPTGVCDAQFAVRGLLGEGLLEHVHFTDRAEPDEVFGSVEHRNAGRVVPPVFEPAQSFHQDRYDVPLSDSTHDSAHTVKTLRRGGKFALNARNVPTSLAKA